MEVAFLQISYLIIYIYCDEAKRVLPLCFSPGICLLSVLVVIRRNELYKSLALHSHLILEGASKCDILGHNV